MYSREKILDFIKESEENLKFNLNSSEKDFFIDNFSKYIHKMDLVKNFNFKNYEKYLSLSFDEQITIPFSRLRNDIGTQMDNPHKLFENSVKFEDGYVVLKNEK